MTRPTMMVLLSLLLASAAHAQATSTQQREVEARAREAQAVQRVEALLQAERSRPRLAGIWRVQSPALALLTEDGAMPPLNAAGRKLLQERQQAMKAGRSVDPMGQCLPPGWPRALWVDAPFLLAQAPAKVTLYHQHRHLVRHVFLDGPLALPADAEPTWEGHSAGRWEGDTLVTETVGFKPKEAVRVDFGFFAYISPDSRVTERFTLLNSDEIFYEFTVSDPVAYTQPWKGELTFRRSPDRIYEYACHEGNHSVVNILTGAREMERMGVTPAVTRPRARIDRE